MITTAGKLEELQATIEKVIHGKSDVVELALVTLIQSAKDRLAQPESLFETIGLLGIDPGSDVEAAGTDFEAGKVSDASAAAARAVSARDGAEEAGKLRSIFGGVGVVALGASGFTAAWARRRRRARSAANEPPPIEADSPVEPASPAEPEPPSSEEPQP